MDQELKAVGWQIHLGNSPEEKDPSILEIEEWLDLMDGEAVKFLSFRSKSREVQLHGGLQHEVVTTFIPDRNRQHEWFRPIDMKFWESNEISYVCKNKSDSEYYRFEALPLSLVKKAILEFIFAGTLSNELIWVDSKIELIHRPSAS